MAEKAKLYNFRDKLALVGQYLLTGGILAGSTLLSGPVVLGVVSTVVMASSLVQYSIKKIRGIKKPENNFVNHMEEETLPSNLEGKLELMCKKLGLSLNDIEFCDVKLKYSPVPNYYSDCISQKYRADAISSYFDKPIVRISEQLLELLDDDEVEAVCAHEMSHVGSRCEQKAGLADRLLAISNFSNLVTTSFEAFATGASAMVTLCSAGLISGASSKKTRSLAMLGGAAAASYINPYLMEVLVATYALSASVGLVRAKFSRNSEYQADRNASTVMEAKPLSLVTALRKISMVHEKQLSCFTSKDLPEGGYLKEKWEKINLNWAELNGSHPTLKNRFNRLADIARTQGATENEIDQAVNGELDISDHGEMEAPHFVDISFMIV